MTPITTPSISRRTPLADLPERLRVGEAAAWLDISTGTVRQMIERHQLQAIRCGRLVRVLRDSLAAQVTP